MKVYKKLVSKILTQGEEKESRSGGKTLSCFGHHYSHDLADGFPLLTTKKVKWEHIILENLWFLSGEKNIDFLQHYGVKFWDPWVDPDTNEVPSAYGYYWRRHNSDQIGYALATLREDNNSRRAFVTAWTPPNAHCSTLPPCHAAFGLHVSPTGRLNLALFQRSCDVALGLPYNIAGYSLLQSIFAQILGLRPGVFSHSIIDAHIYANGAYDHVPNLRKQMLRYTRELPQLQLDKGIKTLKDIEDVIDARPSMSELLDIFKLTGYNPHPAIKFNVAV